MRAFMSAGGNRLTAGRALLRGQVDGRTIGQRIADQGAMAEREARAILAETEPIIAPGQEHTRSDMNQTVCTRDYATYRVASDCLADALAAFVAEEE